LPKREDIEAQIAALQAELDAGDDDYEIEIRDGDKAVRLPSGQGTPWLRKHFPDLYEELLGDADGGDAADPKAGKGKPAADDGKVTPVHFRRRA
jgi:hypothetical protein